MKKISIRASIAASALLAAAGVPAVSSAATGDDVLLNEILVSTTGSDAEYIELFGSPGFSMEGLSIIGVEADAGQSATIDFQYDFDAADLVGDNGFLLVGNELVAGVYGVTPDIGIPQNALENSSATYALVETSSIDGGGATAVLDAVHITDADNDPALLGAPSVGPDGSFLPAGVGRFSDGVDTDGPGDWEILSFGHDSPPNTPTSGGGEPDPLLATIMEIQGAGHLSPLTGELVTTTGVVTAAAFRGFYMQDPVGDGDDDTSDGIFVSSNLDVSPNDVVRLTGVVEENIGGGPATGNLSVTRIVASDAEVVLTAPLPEPVEIGKRGRLASNTVTISEDELPVNLQDVPGEFDPENDAIDFWESLEGMYVEIDRPVTVSATRTFNAFSSEFFVLPSRGERPVVFPFDSRTRRGGIELISNVEGTGDLNPERVQIQFDGTIYPGDVPAFPVDTDMRDVRGVVGYSFGNFEVNATEIVTGFPRNIRPQKTNLRALPRQLTVASYNVLNLDPSDVDQLVTVGGHIANNLASPDIVALQEIQDNNGTTNDGTTDASETLDALIQAIATAGGPSYEAFDVAPADNSQGGAPGGNIRNAFLFNPLRVEPTLIQDLSSERLASIGVSDPTAFDGSRVPLLATFAFGGQEITIINNHFSSRFGSTPIFGGPQPFVQAGEEERSAQATANREVVEALQAHDPDVRVMVVGDLNTFQFTDELSEDLAGNVLTNLLDVNGFRAEDRDDKYTFIFDGNSQMLDHMFVTDSLLDAAPKFDIVHVNVDFPRVDASVGSDHEPLVARFTLD